MSQQLTPAQLRYREYLQTPHWKERRMRAIVRAQLHCEACGVFCGPRDVLSPDEYSDQLEAWVEDGREPCAVCGQFCEIQSAEYDERVWLEVHHLTYERLGCERDEDLMALCCNCHDEATEREMFRAQVRKLTPALARDATHGESIAAYLVWAMTRAEPA